MVQYKIKLADQTLNALELERLCKWIIKGKQLTKGPLTVKFENKFSEILGANYVSFVNSGSSANMLAFYALLKSGRLRSRVVVAPAISWVTTITPALQFGMDIHLCDCDSKSLGLDLSHFDELCKRHKPDLAILVHVLGHPNKLDEVQEICRRYGVILIEDACEALGSSYKQKYVGTFGDVGTFSFYYGHQMSTIEGGMIVTKDRTLHNIVRSMRAHGWARDIDEDFRMDWEKKYNIDELQSLYTFYYPGFNCRSTDLNAFLGISQLDQIRKITQIRQNNYEYYCSLLKDDYWVQTSEYSALSSFAFGTLVKNRLEVFKHLQNRGIESRPLVCGNIGRQPFWIDCKKEILLPQADVIHENGLYLPNHTALGREEIDIIVTEFRKVAIPLNTDISQT